MVGEHALHGRLAVCEIGRRFVREQPSDQRTVPRRRGGIEAERVVLGEEAAAQSLRRVGVGEVGPAGRGARHVEQLVGQHRGSIARCGA